MNPQQRSNSDTSGSREEGKEYKGDEVERIV